MDEILALHGGKARIQPLNYDALTQLRNPLYVKMGQTLSDASTDQHGKILAEINANVKLMQLASENGLPYDALKEVIQHSPDGRSDTDDEPDPMEEVEEEGGGGGGGGGSGGSGGGRGPPPSGGGASNGSNSSSSGSGEPEPTEEPQNRGPMDNFRDPDKERRNDRRDPPGGSTSTALFRSNLEMLAQMEQLREETRRAQQQNRVVQEVHNHHTTTNIQPMREIIREIHGPKETIIREFQSQMAPPPVPPAPPQDNTQLLNTLQSAMAQNVDLAQFARQMGMSMAQMAEYMRKNKTETVVASSNNQPPPPPPGGQAQVASIPIYTPRPIAPERSRSRNSARDPVTPMPVDPAPKAAPKPEPPAVPAKADRSRSRGQVPPKPDTKPATAKPSAQPKKPKMPEPPTPAPSRSTSLASTVNYGPSREVSAAPREKSIAKEIERSRSRQGLAVEKEIVLPVQKRGRSPPASKAQIIIDQLVKSEGVREINAHSKRQALIAKSTPRPTRPASAAPIKVRTFDEIAGETDSVPSMKQRTTSLGAAQPRRRLK